MSCCSCKNDHLIDPYNCSECKGNVCYYCAIEQDNKYICKTCREKEIQKEMENNGIMLCSGCDTYCYKKSTKQCEICLGHFCLPCRNILFDILVEENVCMRHKKEKCNYKFHLYNSKRDNYRLLENRCQFATVNEKGERMVCCNYACPDTITLMKSKNNLEANKIKVCHSHLFFCKMCNSEDALTRQKIIKYRWKTLKICVDCCEKWDAFVKALLQNVQDKKMATLDARTLLSLILAKL